MAGIGAATCDQAPRLPAPSPRPGLEEKFQAEIERPTPRPQARADVQAFVRTALADRLAAGNLPDLNLLSSGDPVIVHSDMPRAGTSLGLEALPAGFGAVLMSGRELQAYADTHGRSVYVIAVDQPELSDAYASVWLGVDVVA